MYKSYGLSNPMSSIWVVILFTTQYLMQPKPNVLIFYMPFMQVDFLKLLPFCKLFSYLMVMGQM